MERVYTAVIAGLILAAITPFLPQVVRHILKTSLFKESPESYIFRLRDSWHYCKKCWDAGKVRRMQLTTLLSWGEGKANSAEGYICPQEKTHV